MKRALSSSGGNVGLGHRMWVAHLGPPLLFSPNRHPQVIINLIYPFVRDEVLPMTKTNVILNPRLLSIPLKDWGMLRIIKDGGPRNHHMIPPDQLEVIPPEVNLLYPRVSVLPQGPYPCLYPVGPKTMDLGPNIKIKTKEEIIHPKVKIKIKINMKIN